MLKSAIKVGDLVEVDLKMGIKPFEGTVLATNLPIGSYEFTWFKVKPDTSNEMPGNFWYKDTEVKKVTHGKERKNATKKPTGAKTK